MKKIIQCLLGISCFYLANAEILTIENSRNHYFCDQRADENWNIYHLKSNITIKDYLKYFENIYKDIHFGGNISFSFEKENENQIIYYANAYLPNVGIIDYKILLEKELSKDGKICMLPKRMKSSSRFGTSDVKYEEKINHSLLTQDLLLLMTGEISENKFKKYKNKDDGF